jgi:HlyD family secretion protein
MSRRERIVGLIAIAGLLVAIMLGLANSRRVAGDPEDTVWTETVKRGPMPWDVRGTGTLVHAQNPLKLIARVAVPEVMAGELQLNQNADVDTRKVLVDGHVSYISQLPSNGMRSVNIVFKSALPEGVSEGLQVDATIHLGTLENILYVGRPVHANPNSSISVFKLVDGGEQAVRVIVKFGRASVNTIEVLDGLKEGDQIIPSDMSAWNNDNQIRLK